jgi:16S rRNA (cytidine1402-2'-O)-methyltransferase
MTLFLLPNLLGDVSRTDELSQSALRAAAQINALIAESDKEARRFLKRIFPQTFRDIPIHLLNEHTSPKGVYGLVEQIVQGGIWGLISDCGMPCLADPGAALVFQARQHGVQIKAFAGPSSILLALVLSGMGGQRFTFHGYLPKEKGAVVCMLKEMQCASQRENSVHLFIEAPYRNDKLFAQLLEHLGDKTLVGVASDLTLPTECIRVHTVAEWKKKNSSRLDGQPTVFLLKSFL